MIINIGNPTPICSITIDKIEVGQVFFGKVSVYHTDNAPALKLQNNEILNLETCKLWKGHTPETTIYNYQPISTELRRAYESSNQSVDRDCVNMDNWIHNCPTCMAHHRLHQKQMDT